MPEHVASQTAGAPERKPPARAGTVRASLPDYLPARMLNEFVYCPRLFFYEWVEGVFVHSVDTLEGAFRHATIDSKEDALPQAGEKERIHSRSVQLSSEKHHLIAKIDLVEGDGESVTPVDYKKGRPRDGQNGPEAWPGDRVQIAAQALILRENGYHCEEGVIYYSATRQRVRVAVGEALENETTRAIEEARRLAQGGRIPPPLIDSPKCPRCSFAGICLPDETNLWLDDSRSPDPRQLELFALSPPRQDTMRGEHGEAAVRRLVPARDDLRPLYVIGHGMTIGKSGGVLQIRERDRPVQEVRIGEISQLNVFGNIQLTAAAIQGLCDAERPIAHFSYGGWFYGLTQGLGLKNVFLRRDQFALSSQEWFCLRIAREIVASKIRNQRTMLQRNHIEPPALALKQLKHFAALAEHAATMDELLGIEGNSARIYFAHFAGMLKVSDEHCPEMEFSFDFEHRNRRPPRDPVNALLSFAYSLLAKDLTITCHTVGFDPFLGFFHQPRFGRPALALDLMEGFRPLIADSAVLTAINTRMVGLGDFVRVGPATALTQKGRKAFLRAYEQRMDTLVTHPLFGYRVNYRRILEVQTRLLARVVTGEVQRYEGFETR